MRWERLRAAVRCVSAQEEEEEEEEEANLSLNWTNMFFARLPFLPLLAGYGTEKERNTREPSSQVT